MTGTLPVTERLLGPTHGPPTQGTAFHGTPTQGTATQGTATQGPPIPGTLIQGAPTPRTLAQGPPTQPTPTHRAELLRDDEPDARARLADLLSDPGIEVFDRTAGLAHQLQGLRPGPTPAQVSEPYQWAFFPWRRCLVRLPGPAAFDRLRLDRNRNKITEAEQAEFRRLRIGVVGLSVGHAIAHTLLTRWAG